MSVTDNSVVPGDVYKGSIELPTWTDAAVLAANTSETYTTPTNCNWWLLSADGGFYVKRGATAAIPAADVVNGAAAFYVPAGLQCKVPGGTQVAFIASATRVITIAPYPI